jgi:hypothetical protein
MIDYPASNLTGVADERDLGGLSSAPGGKAALAAYASELGPGCRATLPAYDRRSRLLAMSRRTGSAYPETSPSRPHRGPATHHASRSWVARGRRPPYMQARCGDGCQHNPRRGQVTLARPGERGLCCYDLPLQRLPRWDRRVGVLRRPHNVLAGLRREHFRTPPLPGVSCGAFRGPLGGVSLVRAFRTTFGDMDAPPGLGRGIRTFSVSRLQSEAAVDPHRNDGPSRPETTRAESVEPPYTAPLGNGVDTTSVESSPTVRS